MINRYSIKELKELKAAFNRDEKFEERINCIYEALKENAKHGVQYYVLRKDRCSSSWWKALSSKMAENEFKENGFRYRLFEDAGDNGTDAFIEISWS